MARPVVRGIEVFARSTAEPAEVWRWLADAESWSAWSRLQRTGLEREGTLEPDGVGAIRRFSAGMGVSREEVVAFEPPHHLGYILLSGLPVRDYRADVELTADGEGTLIAWRCHYVPKLSASGPLMDLFLRTVLKTFARGLARHTTHAA